MMILDILKQTVTIAVFVMIMMTLLEFLALQKHGRIMQRFQSKPFMQIIFAILLGMIPGCIGSFAVVSMYIHGTLRFGALIANLIASSGDEAFIMMSVMPKQMLVLSVLLFVIAVVSGLIVNMIQKKHPTLDTMSSHIVIHTEELAHKKFELNSIFKHLRHISWQRAVILASLLLFTGLTFLGDAHGHPEVAGAEHVHNSEMAHWLQLFFLGASVVGFVIALASPNHFLNDHIWGHIIKKHFVRIFLWTFGAFFVLHLLNAFFDLHAWIEANQDIKYILLLIAVLVGLIPESGPHIIFVSLYVSGLAPLSVLMANSIVQDGHGAIPLLAETRKGFIRAKIINSIVALIVGFTMLFLGF